MFNSLRNQRPKIFELLCSNLIVNKTMLLPTTLTQHNLVLIRLQHKISFLTSCTISKQLKKSYYFYMSWNIFNYNFIIKASPQIFFFKQFLNIQKIPFLLSSNPTSLTSTTKSTTTPGTPPTLEELQYIQQQRIHLLRQQCDRYQKCIRINERDSIIEKE